ncbi:MAG: nuclear transport factor 2 family protein [Blastocatellia bacterium]|nr:nuclear transport factor 2 family protein [Blastocatellia bacterium]MDW8166880.1 nuclear transport factor 2 family protein [Acidobacteriota bacterium]
MGGIYPYEYYIEMVENKYFENVDRKDLAAVLDCFCPDAIFTIRSTTVDEGRTRLVVTTHQGRDTGIKRMFENLFDNYSFMVHKDFTHVVDVERGRCAAQFDVILIAADGRQINMSNCNFFYLEQGKFKRVDVYMSGENVLV